MAWTEISEAYYYQLIIIDTGDAEVVGQHETRNNHLGRDDAFVLSLLSKLKPNRVYSLRIDAVDVQNRRIQSSDPIEFSLPD